MGKESWPKIMATSRYANQFNKNSESKAKPMGYSDMNTNKDYSNIIRPKVIIKKEPEKNSLTKKSVNSKYNELNFTSEIEAKDKLHFDNFIKNHKSDYIILISGTFSLKVTQTISNNGYYKIISFYKHYKKFEKGMIIDPKEKKRIILFGLSKAFEHINLSNKNLYVFSNSRSVNFNKTNYNDKYTNFVKNKLKTKQIKIHSIYLSSTNSLIEKYIDGENKANLLD